MAVPVWPPQLLVLVGPGACIPPVRRARPAPCRARLGTLDGLPVCVVSCPSLPPVRVQAVSDSTQAIKRDAQYAKAYAIRADGEGRGLCTP